MNLSKKKNGTRKVKEKVDSFIWSLVTGIFYDGTFDFPIPFLGVSAIDYDFLKTGTQLSALLVIPVLALNLSKQFKGNFTLGSDLFLSAYPRDDRLFRDGLESENEAVYIFSESFGLRLSWQPITDLSITTSTYLIYEHFLVKDNTSKDFVLPRNGFTVNPNLVINYSSKGYLLQLSASFFSRLAWENWGLPERNESLQKTYTKFSALFSKRFYLSSFTRIGADFAYFTGMDLDRFSRFQPSMLSVPKIRGVPSGAISLENIGVLSLNIGFTIFDFVRFDIYYNFARGSENNVNNQIDFQGIELDFGTFGPWQSYIQGRVAYAVAGPLERYNSRWAVYLMMFVPLK